MIADILVDDLLILPIEGEKGGFLISAMTVSCDMSARIDHGTGQLLKKGGINCTECERKLLSAITRIGNLLYSIQI